MDTNKINYIIIAILTGALFLALYFIINRPDPNPNTPPRFYQTIDSLEQEIALLCLEKDSLLTLVNENEFLIDELYVNIDDKEKTLRSQRSRIYELQRLRDQLSSVNPTSSELLELLINYLNKHKHEF